MPPLPVVSLTTVRELVRELNGFSTQDLGCSEVLNDGKRLRNVTPAIIAATLSRMHCFTLYRYGMRNREDGNECVAQASGTKPPRGDSATCT